MDALRRALRMRLRARRRPLGSLSADGYVTDMTDDPDHCPRAAHRRRGCRSEQQPAPWRRRSSAAARRSRAGLAELGAAVFVLDGERRAAPRRLFCRPLLPDRPSRMRAGRRIRMSNNIIKHFGRGEPLEQEDHRPESRTMGIRRSVLRFPRSRSRAARCTATFTILGVEPARSARAPSEPHRVYRRAAAAPGSIGGAARRLPTSGLQHPRRPPGQSQKTRRAAQDSIADRWELGVRRRRTPRCRCLSGFRTSAESSNP